MNHFQINDFDKATQFITILKTFKSYNDHITFQLLDERLYIQGMDHSHISLYELNITFGSQIIKSIHLTNGLLVFHLIFLLRFYHYFQETILLISLWMKKKVCFS